MHNNSVSWICRVDISVLWKTKVRERDGPKGLQSWNKTHIYLISKSILILLSQALSLSHSLYISPDTEEIILYNSGYSDTSIDIVFTCIFSTLIVETDILGRKYFLK